MEGKEEEAGGEEEKYNKRLIKGDVQKRGMLCFVVDALRRATMLMILYVLSMIFFSFLRRKNRSVTVYLFFCFIYFSLLDYLYMYIYIVLFFPFLEKEEILVSVRRGQEIMYHLFSMRRCFSCIFLVFSVN